MTSAIVVSHLVKRYKGAKVNAVDDVSFTVKPGEFFTLLGPNGAGKTTTISILTTTLAPTSGQVTIGGYDIITQQAQVRRQTGIIFQSPSLDQKLTAEENIRFHVALYNLYPYRPTLAMMAKEYHQQIADLASVLGLTKSDMAKPVSALSGGMKRKLEIIRSLMHHPKVLFLDEPTSGLDPKSRRDLWTYLTDIRKKEHMTVFLTTHYLEEAESSDTVCIINQGKVVALGSPAQLKRKFATQKTTLEDVYLRIIASTQNT